MYSRYVYNNNNLSKYYETEKIDFFKISIVLNTGMGASAEKGRWCTVLSKN